MEKSVWKKGTVKPEFEVLDKDIKTDVLVIGGGMAGLLTAYFLKNAGVKCVVAEAGEICGGVTGNTSAKISCHHGAIFDKMIRRYGKERAALYLKANEAALHRFRKLSENIDCDFNDVTSYVYSLSDRRKIEREAEALSMIGASAHFLSSVDLPFSVAGAVSMHGQAMFHPLKFAYKIASELEIYENTKVYELTDSGALTNRGKIKAQKTVVTTHFPILNKRGMYFLKMYQHRSYVLALKNANPVNGIYIDEAEGGLSFRMANDILLLGGGAHRTGKNGGGFGELSRVHRLYYPEAEEVCRFATQDCKTLDDIAYIGEYSPNTKGLLVASGFNKWGMSTSMVAADILCDMILGKKNDYAELFSPARNMFCKQLFANIGHTALNFIRFTAPRCSHLGCALKYNKAEHSWDCPCHGSRFDDSGEVIDNPAMHGISPP